MHPNKKYGKLLPPLFDYTSKALVQAFLFNIGRRKKFNSSTKLKEKTQPHGGTFLLLRETQEKNLIFPPKNLKTEENSWGTLSCLL